MLCLPNLTGLRKVNDLENKFNCCINYNLTCEIETVLPETAQRLLAEGIILLRQLLSPENVHAHSEKVHSRLIS